MSRVSRPGKRYRGLENAFRKLNAPVHINRCRTRSLAETRRDLRSTVGVKQCTHYRVSATANVVSLFENKAVGTPEFDWHKHWWPVQLTANLDTDRPNRVQLLGEFFVAWKGKEGDWIVMKDMCPHRLAPLSEGEPEGYDDVVCQLVSTGRVEDDGTLMCSYHGWRFNDCGKCVKIPQSDDQKSQETACNSQRSAATVYPSKARGGVLWIWPDLSKGSRQEAASASFPLPGDIADFVEEREREGLELGFTRLLPYTFNTLAENLIDPAHVPFAHHGVSSKIVRSAGKPMHMKDRLAGGVEYNGYSSGYAEMHSFGASTILYKHNRPDPELSSGMQVFLISPVADGLSRIILLGELPRGALTGNPVPSESFVSSVLRGMPVLAHFKLNSLLDGDSVLLYEQERNLSLMERNGSSSRAYFLPTSSDLVVQRFRNWVESEGGGGPFGTAAAMSKERLHKRALLDRYTQHTQECRICQKALVSVKRMIMLCGSLLYAALAAAVVLLVRSTQRGSLAARPTAAVLFVGLVSLWVQNFLQKKVLPEFYFVDYVHADND